MRDLREVPDRQDHDPERAEVGEGASPDTRCLLVRPRQPQRPAVQGAFVAVGHGLRGIQAATELDLCLPFSRQPE